MLDKAMSLLDCFRPAGGRLRLADLSARTGLARSTVHRLAADLVRLGLLERSGDEYQLGGLLFEFGTLVPRRQDLRETALPFLQDLYEATRETVHLGIREDRSVIYVERIHGHERLPLPSRVGGALPLTCTGVGKVLLAFSPQDFTEEILAGPLPRLTPHSVTDPARLRPILEQVRVAGLAYEEQEAVTGISCVASPVFAPDGTAVAAISVAVPVTRWHPAQLATAVRTAALGLTRALRMPAAMSGSLTRPDASR
ncbi:IclR family transcriptional regulator [Streptomyces sp. NPDC052052]|uniref:IclR family transcriptional regulator n=1 Tax=Streptomyces sp. NPDC052052 TaxID=3154756 RepID=UPI003418FA7E